MDRGVQLVAAAGKGFVPSARLPDWEGLPVKVESHYRCGTISTLMADALPRLAVEITCK